MNEQDLLNWIQNQKQNNFSKEQIYSTLIKNNLKQEIAQKLINQVFNEPNQQTQTINQQSQSQNTQSNQYQQNQNPNQKFDINNPHPPKKQIIITIIVCIVITVLAITGLYFMFNSPTEKTIENQILD